MTMEIGMEIKLVRYDAWILGPGWKKSIEVKFIAFYSLTAVESNFLRSV